MQARRKRRKNLRQNSYISFLAGYTMEDILQALGDEYKNKLDLEGFSNMMKNPSYCYKFYWLEAIVNLISEGVVSTTVKAAFLWMVQGRRQDIKILRLNMKI